ncbi:MAG: YgcG family protein [Desulfovibrionaceae bacterium]
MSRSFLPVGRLSRPVLVALAAAVLLGVLLLASGPAHALDAPALTARVNDLAGMMSPQARSAIEAELANLEASDSTQVAVLTVPTLDGDAIDAFALRVAEKWRLGQKGRDNGVLLVVAKAERKVRIEVGYGLEGRLTDLLAGRIIDNEITPRFKQGDFDGGFAAGTLGIIQAVRGEYKGAGKPASRRSEGSGLGKLALLAMLFLVFGMGRGGRGGGLLTGLLLGSMMSGGSRHDSGGGGFGGGGFGGFSGGGGGFGGGGASGGW